ncbi:right-handed parallel beta-helix repeat-containing protein [Sphingobacterium pedocola]|uniref:Right handed beta helix domain-containing protein n=1 Tax=Sphingobacterium pedocola TaxID=2082722 RepID=A0ABR9TD21_9SPHI|nr:right-handed parallel beta-helix repeat-containing protein [Sphingobacterium pedocola]MBE8723260.1 hypothetical protein [Sphingobacterium pedocola]
MRISVCAINVGLLVLFFGGWCGVAAQEGVGNERVVLVSGPGFYVEPGVTYRLTKDIHSDHSGLFLGKDVTLDLNGFTVYYADGGYNNLLNGGFEQGITGWGLSSAPGAKVVNTKDVHVFVGEKLMSLKAGDEIVSSYMELPVADRSYYAMCGVTGYYYEDMKGDMNNEMRVSVFVEDEQGKSIRCLTEYADSAALSCPTINQSPRLGGGFVMAHLQGLPAGKYRVRVRAETDCLVDEIDIRPAFDVGVGIVGRVERYGHYGHLFEGRFGAFFDHAKVFSADASTSGMKQVTGEGTVTIRNGRIKNAAVGVLSAGVQSTADDVRLVLEQVEFESAGISTVAVEGLYGSIRHCKFDIQSPFVINRHGNQFMAVNLRGERPSEVSYSTFYGGQGCLTVKGIKSVIHDNLFVNRQTVTNHYSLSPSGDSTRVFNNRFEPEIGSGIGIYRRKGVEVYNNFFRITAAPPSCEYNLDYSTNGIRISDYGAKTGDPKGAIGNKIYGNTFEIIGKAFPEYPNYVPLATAIFYSASAGGNEVFDNDISVVLEDSTSNTQAYAFYIGNANEGLLYDNRIRANATPIWVATVYDGASNIDLSRNRISRITDSVPDFASVRLGYQYGSRPATSISFRSTQVDGMPFRIAREGSAETSYRVLWTLELELVSSKRKKIKTRLVEMFDRKGQRVFSGVAKDGKVLTELLACAVNNEIKEVFSPFRVRVGKKERLVELDKDTKVVFSLD